VIPSRAFSLHWLIWSNFLAEARASRRDNNALILIHLTDPFLIPLWISLNKGLRAVLMWLLKILKFYSLSGYTANTLRALTPLCSIIQSIIHAIWPRACIIPRMKKGSTRDLIILLVSQSYLCSFHSLKSGHWY